MFDACPIATPKTRIGDKRKFGSVYAISPTTEVQAQVPHPAFETRSLPNPLTRNTKAL